MPQPDLCRDVARRGQSVSRCSITVHGPVHSIECLCVSIENATLEWMTDFLVGPHTHPMIMNSDRVIRQTSHFLRHGSFERLAE